MELWDCTTDDMPPVGLLLIAIPASIFAAPVYGVMALVWWWRNRDLDRRIRYLSVQLGRPRMEFRAS